MKYLFPKVKNGYVKSRELLSLYYTTQAPKVNLEEDAVLLQVTAACFPRMADRMAGTAGQMEEGSSYVRVPF